MFYSLCLCSVTVVPFPFRQVSNLLSGVYSAVSTALLFVFPNAYLKLVHLGLQRLPFSVNLKILSGKTLVVGILGCMWVTQKKTRKTDVLRTEVTSRLASSRGLPHHFFPRTGFG